MSKQFERNLGFLSKAEQKRLLESCVAVAGTGGDGGELAIALARLGVGRFHLADPEIFEEQNLNRQAGANYETIGLNKAKVIAEEIRRINPRAKITVFEDGVTPDNIDRFIEGADLILDETEYTKPEIGALIARKARKAGIPVTMALNVGYGGRVTSFHPLRGETFESWLGLDPTASLDEIAKAPVPLKRWIGDIPKYINTDMLTKVQNGTIPAPSVSPGVLIAAGVAATQVQEILLSGITPERGKDVVWAPKMISIDAKDGPRMINSKSPTRFPISALRASARTRRGKNPPYDL